MLFVIFFIEEPKNDWMDQKQQILYKTPMFRWSQNKSFIYIHFDVPQSVRVNCTINTHGISIQMMTNDMKTHYHVELNLKDEIKPDESVCESKTRTVSLTLQKSIHQMWPSLLSKSTDYKSHCTYDWDDYRTEEEEARKEMHEAVIRRQQKSALHNTEPDSDNECEHEYDPT